MASAKLAGASQLDARLRALQSTRGLTHRLGLGTVREAKLLVPRRTGNLGRSIHIQSESDTQVVVVASAEYAGFVERGTRPHIIRPVRARALAFAASPAGRRLSGRVRRGAAVVFAMLVHHPGTKPEPFLRPGAQKAASGSNLAAVVIEEWNAAA